MIAIPIWKNYKVSDKQEEITIDEEQLE